jgi:hypothetical protein
MLTQILLIIIVFAFTSEYCTDKKYGNYCNYGHVYRNGIRPIDELDTICYRRSICSATEWCECQEMFYLMRMKTTSEDRECLLYWNNCVPKYQYYTGYDNSLIIPTGGDGWNFYAIFNDQGNTYHISVNETMYIATYSDYDTYLQAASQAPNRPDIFRVTPFTRINVAEKIIVLSNQKITTYKMYNTFTIQDITLAVTNQKYAVYLEESIKKMTADNKTITNLSALITRDNKTIADMTTLIAENNKTIADLSALVTRYGKTISDLSRSNPLRLIWIALYIVYYIAIALIVIGLVLVGLSRLCHKTRHLNERVDEISP